MILRVHSRGNLLLRLINLSTPRARRHTVYKLFNGSKSHLFNGIKTIQRKLKLHVGDCWIKVRSSSSLSYPKEHQAPSKAHTSTSKMTSFLASLVILAALALVAILSRPGGANNVSTNKGDWVHTYLTSQPK
jgi:hypothetical protein